MAAATGASGEEPGLRLRSAVSGIDDVAEHARRGLVQGGPAPAPHAAKDEARRSGYAIACLVCTILASEAVTFRSVCAIVDGERWQRD